MPLRLIEAVEEDGPLPAASRRPAPVAATPPAPPPPASIPPPAPAARSPAELETIEVNLGEPLKLAVSADGTPPLRFQWRKGGRPIAGATQARITLENVRDEDAGNYDCVVSNTAGEQASPLVRVIVRQP